MTCVFYYCYNFLLTNFCDFIRLSEKHLSDPPPKRVLKTLTAGLASQASPAVECGGRCLFYASP